MAYAAYSKKASISLRELATRYHENGDVMRVHFVRLRCANRSYECWQICQDRSRSKSARTIDSQDHLDIALLLDTMQTPIHFLTTIMQTTLYPRIANTPEPRSLRSVVYASKGFMLVATINNNDSNSNSGWGRFAVSALYQIK